MHLSKVIMLMADVETLCADSLKQPSHSFQLMRPCRVLLHILVVVTIPFFATLLNLLQSCLGIYSLAELWVF